MSIRLNYIPGFCINTEQRDSVSLLERWVTFFGGRISAGDERSVITFIIERLDRDLSRLDLYAPTIKRLGFRLHVRINNPTFGATLVRSIQSAYPWATVAAAIFWTCFSISFIKEVEINPSRNVKYDGIGSFFCWAMRSL